MLRLLIAFFAVLLLQVSFVSAQEFPHCAPGQTPAFQFGFATLEQVLGERMGQPIECAHPNPENGDTLQRTTTGLAYWDKGTNTPTFTNGWEHWALTDRGLLLWVGESVTPPPDARPVPPPTAASPPTRVGLQLLVAEGLTSPVALVEPPDGTGRLFIVDQVGLIHIFLPDGSLLPQPFLDVRGSLVPLNPSIDERGLLGLAFHPEFADNGRLFVYYSAPLRAGAPGGFDHTSHLSEFRVSADPSQADPASERVLLRVDQPQANHNGGTVAFGPDGLLYLSLGDGGGANDEGLGHAEDWYAANAGGNGQDIDSNLLGSILRIDVDRGDAYAVPPDNPFVGTEGLDEIFAYGFRNPYRFSFDMGGELGVLAADAGQNLWEEVSQVVEGGNFGWNVREGTHCFSTATPSVSPPSCPETAPGGVLLREPVLEYASANQGGPGLAVVGGFVYRGQALPRLEGLFVFGDWSRSFASGDGSLFVATPQPEGLWPMQEFEIVTRPGGRLSHFLLGLGQDRAGELYLLTTDNSGPTGTTGRVYRLIPAG